MDHDLRRTLDALPALVSTLDRELRYLFLNREHRRWFGIDPQAGTGRTLAEVVGDDVAALLRPGVDRALAGEQVDLELELPARFDWRWVRVAITPECDDEGPAARIHVLVTDLDRASALARRLERSESMFDAAFAAAGVGKALVEDDGTIRQVNPAFAAMLGTTPAALVGRHFTDITHPDDIDTDLAQFVALRSGQIDGYALEKRYLAAGGGVVEALLTVTVVRATQRSPQFYVSQILDVGDRKQAEQRTRERNAELELALEMVDGGVWRYTIATGELHLSRKLAETIGLPADEGFPIAAALERVHPDDRAPLAAERLAHDGQERMSSLFRVRGIAGDWRWLRWRRQQVRDARGTPVSVLGVVFDVTGEQEREARLAEQAITDPLTGLLNRRGFDAALAPAMRPNRATRPALLMIDLDHFKPINDTHGHLAGDRVLQEVGRRLRETVRGGDIVARLGGDEFAVLLADADRPAAERAAARIVAALAEPCRIGGIAMQAGASVGVATASAWDDACTLMTRADRVLYKVKRGGRGTWRLAA